MQFRKAAEGIRPGNVSSAVPCLRAKHAPGTSDFVKASRRTEHAKLQDAQREGTARKGRPVQQSAAHWAGLCSGLTARRRNMHTIPSLRALQRREAEYGWAWMLGTACAFRGVWGMGWEYVWVGVRDSLGVQGGVAGRMLMQGCVGTGGDDLLRPYRLRTMKTLLAGMHTRLQSCVPYKSQYVGR